MCTSQVKQLPESDDDEEEDEEAADVAGGWSSDVSNDSDGRSDKGSGDEDVPALADMAKKNRKGGRKASATEARRPASGKASCSRCGKTAKDPIHLAR